MSTTRKLQYKAVNDSASTHIGKPGDVFYDPASTELRIYNGTAGGQVINEQTLTSLALVESTLNYVDEAGDTTAIDLSSLGGSSGPSVQYVTTSITLPGFGSATIEAFTVPANSRIIGLTIAGRDLVGPPQFESFNIVNSSVQGLCTIAQFSNGGVVTIGSTEFSSNTWGTLSNIGSASEVFSITVNSPQWTNGTLDITATYVSTV